MNTDAERILSRMLAVEETASVSGARPTSPAADTRIHINGNPDTSPTFDFETVADSTTSSLLDPSPDSTGR